MAQVLVWSFSLQTTHEPIALLCLDFFAIALLVRIPLLICSAGSPLKCLRLVGALELFLSHRMYLLVILRVLTPPQKRQLIVHNCELKIQVEGFVGELTL